MSSPYTSFAELAVNSLRLTIRRVSRSICGTCNQKRTSWTFIAAFNVLFQPQHPIGLRVVLGCPSTFEAEKFEKLREKRELKLLSLLGMLSIISRPPKRGIHPRQRASAQDYSGRSSRDIASGRHMDLSMVVARYLKLCESHQGPPTSSHVSYSRISALDKRRR